MYEIHWRELQTPKHNAPGAIWGRCGIAGGGGLGGRLGVATLTILQSGLLETQHQRVPVGRAAFSVGADMVCRDGAATGAVHSGDVCAGAGCLGRVVRRIPDEESVSLMFLAPLVKRLVGSEVDHPV